MESLTRTSYNSTKGIQMKVSSLMYSHFLENLSRTHRNYEQIILELTCQCYLFGGCGWFAIGHSAGILSFFFLRECQSV